MNRVFAADAKGSRPRVAITGAGVWANPNLAQLLGDCDLRRLHGARGAAWRDIDAVLAWGNKPSAQRAARQARAHGLPVWRIEDGLLRSLGLGHRDPALSIVVDDEGIYYDARAPSRLETLVRAGVDEAASARAEALRQRWCAARVSKYNEAREPEGLAWPDRYVLVVDQTAGDQSVAGGLADRDSFARMLACALAEHPDATVLLKVHPDVVAGRKRGHFDLAALRREPRIRVIAEAAHPVALVERAAAVYVVSSQLGFEALLHGRPVRVFGMPFYAGWGLTQDELPSPARRGAATLAALVHAALIAYPRYLDPDTGERCTAERLVDWMGFQRSQRQRFPAVVHACGFSPWKRPLLQRFLAGSVVHFHKRPRGLPPGATVAVWGRAAVDALPANVHALVVEDGFLRSVGLGADLVAPVSWVIDDVGIYYDATRPSRLEQRLATADVDAAQRARAAGLRERICAEGITKYNLAGTPWRRPAAAERVILVPGQVESDASIRWGGTDVGTNLDLLRAVRAENPDAWVVYKPHPDVVAGLRRRGEGESGVAPFCNEVVVDAPIQQLLAAVDEVHVRTSLAGFEALLRGKRVVCWGLPFYAGWGLTEDRHACARRGRRRTLDELVALTLLDYPTYASRDTGRFITAEQALDELRRWREQGPPVPGPWRRLKRAVLRLRARLLD